MNTQERGQMIQGMRDCADWLEAHPEAEHIDVNAWIFDRGSSNEEIAEIVKAMGSVEKNYSGEDLFIKKMFGGMQITYCVNRSAVCERIVTGTKTSPAQFTPEQTVEVVEWRCGSILEKAEVEA